MSYSTAITELREIIADTPLNKRTTKKRLVGQVDGSNTLFYTYDKRIFENTLQVFLNDQLVTSGYSLNDPIGGEIEFNSAPDPNTEMTATYYWQWWTDDEIINFLNKGAESVGITDPNANAPTPSDNAYLQIPGGLKNATLNFAASYAFKAIAAYMFARRHSSEFLLEQDGNDDEGYAKLIDSCNKMAAQYMKDGLQMRNDFYEAQGRQYAPSQAIKIVGTRQYGPRR